MARADASLELLAPRDDVWAFLAEPYHLSDWWPGISGVEPDRRGLAPGARWRLRRDDAGTLLHRGGASTTLVVREVEPPARVVWHFTHDRLDAELRLRGNGDRTVATLTVSGPLVLAFRRSLPRRALSRLHALCQTAAGL